MHGTTMHLIPTRKWTQRGIAAHPLSVLSVARIGLTRTIHEYCRAFTCSFARNESLINRPYARLRTISSKSIADKGTAQSSQ